MDSLLLFAAVVLGLGFVWLSRQFLGTALAPPGAYSIVWMTCCILLASQSDEALTAEGFSLVLLSWIAFGVGGLLPVFFVPEVNARRHSPRWREYVAINEARIVSFLKTANLISIALGLLALAMVYESIRSAGLTDFAVAGMKLRRTVADPTFEPGIDYARNVVLHTIGLGFVYFTVFTGAAVLAAYPRRTIVALMPLVAVLLFSLAKFNREHLLDAMLAYGSGYWLMSYLLGQRIGIPWRVILKVSVPVVVVIITLSVALGKFGETEGTSNIISSAAEHARFRLTVPLENMDRYVEQDSPQWLFGQATLNPLYRMLYAAGVIQDYKRIENRGPSPVNGQMTVLTYSYLKWPFDDFGAAGPPLLAIVFGFLATSFFLAARYAASFTLILVNVAFYVAIGYSFATWRFQDLFIVVALACAALFRLFQERNWLVRGARPAILR